MQGPQPIGPIIDLVIEKTQILKDHAEAVDFAYATLNGEGLRAELDRLQLDLARRLAELFSDAEAA